MDILRDDDIFTVTGGEETILDRVGLQQQRARPAGGLAGGRAAKPNITWENLTR